MNKETEQKISQLQNMEQNMQGFLQQKQQFQTQLLEIESAIKGMEGKEEAYKIIGNIMIKTQSEDLSKDLKEKKEMLEIRVKNVEKQEQLIKDKAKKLQEEVMKEMQPDSKK